MIKTDNRSNGGRFEQELAEELAKNGFWVHVMQQNKSGQPADIIAVKGRFHTLIDCKVISDNKGFPFERIEENQRLAMKTFFNKCGELCYFALKLPNGDVRMVSLEKLDTLLHRGRKRLTEEDMAVHSFTLQRWIEHSNTWAEDL